MSSREDTVKDRRRRTPLPDGIKRRPRPTPHKVKAPPSTPVVDGVGKWSPGVPDNVKTAIGSAIVAYSDMEASLESLIWDLTGVSYDDGKLLTAIDASDKVSIAKALCQRYGLTVPPPARGKPAVWKMMLDMAKLRNMIVHGVWGMHELTVPIVTSFRIKADEADTVISEAFSIDRLLGITQTCEGIKKLLDHMCKIAIALRKTPSRPPQKDPATTGKRP
jgi:hypothetical protein